MTVRLPRLMLPRRILAVLLLTLVAALVTTTTAGLQPARAAAGPCGNLGQAYVITQSGTVYMSGCEGDQRFGVQTISLQRFDVVQLAGNGIKSGTPITFKLSVPDGSTETYTTTNAGKNTVVPQEPNSYFFKGTAPLGLYTFSANYTSANGKSVSNEPVVRVQLRF
jgi:hypothetical protein